ncbi:putative polyketide hydroxylase [Streptomyces afghaniensis 772]|uniref:Putative polyketide hydroxylase n=1 Tax=Streptomyces afghaniensis 772 TaxID=1283301 RepID=S4MGS0_9ACTN|nr:putative polyketide hydroxylase [Streptomyces afghaniensis 772]
MPLHEHVLDSETPQEHGGGKTHQGSAYDENWYRFHSASAHWFPRPPATAQPGNGGLARP